MVTDKAVWLASYLYDKKRATQKQIVQAWMHENLSDGKEMPRRTFQETKKKVERMFDTIIGYDPHTHEYFFEDPQQLGDKGLKGWLLNTCSLTATLERYKHLQQHILLEEPALGQEYLSSLLEAIEQKVQVELHYHPFNRDAYVTRLSPYCLKAFRKRWYVLGYSSRHGEERTFALDRMEGIRLTGDAYAIPFEFDSQRYFRDCLGVIYNGQVQLCNILFRANPQQIPYLRTSPLHPSQEEMGNGLFRIRTFFSYEVVQAFLSYGSGIEVIAPSHVKQRMREEVEKMQRMYGTQPEEKL